MENLKGKEIFELSGITPNPRTDKVYEGIKICKENDIDFILAVGGGSTLDCSKAIAMVQKLMKISGIISSKKKTNQQTLSNLEQ